MGVTNDINKSVDALVKEGTYNYTADDLVGGLVLFAGALITLILLMVL